jgi:AcrR family transcriptional regulator
MEKKTVTREMIVETAAYMLEESGGIKNVTLREIAKRLGCAHTNLYNYFASLTDIYWEVAGWILSKMISDLKDREQKNGDPEGNIFRLLSHFADFSIDHPGWYQFLWLEELVGEPAQHVIEILRRPTDYIFDSVRMTAGVEIPEEKIRQIGDIMFSYTYGEISTWIHHRTSNDSREVFQKRIDTNLRLVYSLMLQDID